MFDDVISTGLQAVLAEVFESVDKRQLNVSLVGDIFKESQIELTDLRLKKTLLKDLNLPVELKEGLVGKLLIQGLSGVMTGDPVSITISEVLMLLAPGKGLSDAEAGLAARRLMATLREMFGNRYAEDFMEDALRVKLEDRMSVQQQNKLNRKVLRHICRKLLASMSITLQTVHVRFELPAGGPGSENPVKTSAGVGGGGACDAVGIMLPSLTIRTCGTDHPAFAKFAAATPLDRLAAKTAAAGAGGLAPPQPAGRAGDEKGEKKNLSVVRKRMTLSNLQVYCDYGVDSYATDIGAAVAAARNTATNPRPGPGGAAAAAQAAAQAAAAGVNRGAVAAARAVRSVFVQKWRSERHALLFTPLAVELGAEVEQWDQPGGKSVTPVYRLVQMNVGIGDLQTVVDSEQGRVLGTVLRDVVDLVRRARYNRFVPQAFLPLRNLPPPKVRPPKPPKDGAPGGMFPSVECWSWSNEIGELNAGGSGRIPGSVSEAVIRGGFKKEGGAWARAMWRFAGACVRRDLRASLTRKLPATLPNWDGTISAPPAPAAPAANGGGSASAAAASANCVDPQSWRVKYLRLHARTLTAREAKSISTLAGGRTPDVRRLGVPRGREPLSLEEMWELARVESFAPGDEIVFLRTVAKLSSHFEWGRARRARAAVKAAASSGNTAAAAALWTIQDDANVLAELDELRIRRAAEAIAKKEGGKSAAGEESEEDEEEEVTRLEFFARDGQSLTDAAAANPFSDDEDESGSEDDSEDEDDSGDEALAKVGRPGGGGGVANGGGTGGRGGGRSSLAEIAALANSGSGAKGVSQPSPLVVRNAGSKKKSGVGSGVWSRLLAIRRVVFEVASVGLELRTRISGGARRPLVSLSAAGLSGTVEGDENRPLLWWEARVGQVTIRDLCSSWGAGETKAGAAAPVARTLLSGSASGVEGRDWAFAGDEAGPAARSFLVARVVHDPNRFACGLFPGAAAMRAELRAHVVVGCITGKIPPQVLAVFNAAARDVLRWEKNTTATGKAIPVPSSAPPGTDSARQLRVALTSIHAFVSTPTSTCFEPKQRRGPSGAVRALSLARGAVARGGSAGRSTSGAAGKSAGELDSKELYRVVAGLLPGDFEIRVHSSEVIVRVESRTEDLLEAGKVAFEALGEEEAAAGMQGSGAGAEDISLEINVASAKVDACRSSQPSPELWVDTGIMRAKLRAPEKAVEAVVTALLTSAQRTKAAVALLSDAAGDETV